jgi:hypothetical protein
LGTWEEVTRKLPEPLAVPPAVVTLTPPLVAPGITIATNVLPLLLIGMAEKPAIVIPVGLLKLVPVIVTSVPTAPELGEKLVMVGCEKTTELINNNTEIKKIFFMKLIYARIIIEYNKWCKYLKQPKTIMR